MSRERIEKDARGGRPLPPRLDPRAGRPARERIAGERSASGTSAPSGRSVVRGGRAAIIGRVVGAVLSAVLLATTGWGWYLGRVAEATVNRTDAIPHSGNTGSGKQSAMNLLLVGNDSRSRLSAAQLSQLHTGSNAGLNTDTMILVHVPADGSRASFVSFPRDSYVEIPGYGWDKLNAAYAFGYQATPSTAPLADRQAGGAQLLVQTISHLTGLQIDHYAEVDLLGFFDLSTVVGGVQVNLCKAVDDRKYSGAVFPAGVQTISGADALKFVRQRHHLPRSDFDRIIRQQVFIAGVMRKMLSSDVATDLGKQRQLVSAVAKSVTVDRNLDLMQLAQQMQSVSTGKIQFQTIPYVGDSHDTAGRYILKLKDLDSLHAFFAQLSADPAAKVAPPKTPAAPTTVAPGKVAVEIFNGSGTRGLAGSAATSLRSRGFVIGSTGNADRTDYTRTEIRYAKGDETLANTLAASIPGATKVASPDPKAGTVQLILGSDFTQVGQKVTSSAPATSATSTGSTGSATVKGEDARTAADTTCIN